MNLRNYRIYEYDFKSSGCSRCDVSFGIHDACTQLKRRSKQATSENLQNGPENFNCRGIFDHSVSEVSSFARYIVHISWRSRLSIHPTVFNPTRRVTRQSQIWMTAMCSSLLMISTLINLLRTLPCDVTHELSMISPVIRAEDFASRLNVRPTTSMRLQ